MKKTSVVLVGINGYGVKIAKDVFANMDKYDITIAGVVVRNIATATLREEVLARNIPYYPSLEAFYQEKKADLAIICTPISCHLEHAALAMRNGSDVLCEKPTAATMTQSEQMEAVAKETGKNLNIAFQLSYIPAVWKLKQDVMDGVLGAPKKLFSLICWPRNKDYYARTWCAKLKWNGEYILDSIAMNACAHYLHLMYFLLGDTMDQAAQPDKVEALLCRANPIETFDTAMLRVQAKGAQLHFLATHTSRKKIEPRMRFEFENAVVEINEREGDGYIRAVFNDGTVKDYGVIQPDYYNKIPYCCRVAEGKEKPVCTPKTASAHLKTINAITELVPVHTIQDTVTENDVVIVEGMDDILEKSFREGKMPWELTNRFGTMTTVELTDYQWGDRI